ncbi:MAG: hypothetical protein HXX10_28565 [Rhodoplanes sp.]|uniref:hypothetical protein n=1 Tax=Rhodoplanes sp. TaxID=1968906 RepID=UPI00179FF5F4|nr:hypothetical protein [Rhodoplanes sp.]NVO17992.1 hypothetical protein [Rhodoplanes sp.]
MTRALPALFVLLALIATAAAQSCNPQAGGSACGAPTRGGPIDFSNPSDDPRASRTPFSGVSNIGRHLTRNDPPATFGSITFSGGRARCAGLFRSGNC